MKAVLVLEMPTVCDECQLYGKPHGRDHGGCNVFNYITFGDTKPEWCPLRPLPQEKKHSEVIDPHEKGYEDEYDYWEIEGWNNCLKEIDMDLKQKSLLYVAISQLERDKRDYKHRMTKSTDKGLVEYYQEIVEACDYAQKIIMEKLNAHD